MTQDRPSEFIQARAEAFKQADYGFVFDSYHTDSMFRQQFTDRDEYIHFGWANLGKEFRIRECRVLKEDVASSGARVIYFMEFEISGQCQAYAELAWLQREEGAWRYHRGQKITADELPCPLDQIDFDTFDQIGEKAIF